MSDPNPAQQIRERVNPDEVEELEPFINGLIRALLAVVDGHRPEPVGTFLGDVPPMLCIDCSAGRYDSVAWPCPELLAIAKALGIEVDRG